MKEIDPLISKLRTIVEANPTYKLEAYSFIMVALHHTVGKLETRRHVSGQELSKGIREFATEQFGPLARQVLEYWGVRRTRDFGEIVFTLIEAGLMSKAQEDSVTDFDRVYDFQEAFGGPYEFNLDDLSWEWDNDEKNVGGYG